jgi:peptidylprolyl isomerase
VKKHINWFRYPALAVVLIITLAACQPAELSVDPTTVSESVVGTTSSLDDSTTSELLQMEGGITTESGLQFFEMTPGEGDTPQVGDIVNLNFVGSLPDGTEFANSFTQGSPVQAIIGRNQLLPGWEEGLMMMSAGSSARMVLPPDLAFGSEGYGMIPPDSPIILVVELLSIEKPPVPMEISLDKLTTTDSGLKYYDITVGSGDEAKEGYLATNHFIIWVQGEPSDLYIGASYDGQPITFEIGKGDTVFPGWEEGVIGMKVGGKRQLVIPPDLALGEAGAGEIPPNATLLMEIELAEVKEPVKMTVVDEADYITTDSGLKYFDIVEGDGAMPEAGQTVVVHYTGWLEDGTKFDSSVDRGQPFSFQLGSGTVIVGWDEGVASMKVGGKRQLVIPPELAYGETGAGSAIPPGATLIFEVELLEIQE